MLIPMYFLIGIWGHERRIYAALKFILYTMLGSILMLVAMIWLYELSGTFDLPRIQAMLDERPGDALAAHRTACSLPRSSWPSPSRCRCSRCTPGCPTRTPKRPRPAR